MHIMISTDSATLVLDFDTYIGSSWVTDGAYGSASSEQK